MTTNLHDLRKEITQISHDIVALLNRRHDISQTIGKEKQRLGLPLRDSVREAILLQNLIDGNTGAYPPQAIEILFQTIFDISVAMQASEREDTTTQ
jgi:chorismate mutase-like protein